MVKRCRQRKDLRKQAGPRWGQHAGEERMLHVAVLEQLLQDGQRERARLPRPRLRQRDEVLPWEQNQTGLRACNRNRPAQPKLGGQRMVGGTLEGVGDGLGLDPGGLLPPHEVARLHQLLADAKLRERRRQASMTTSSAMELFYFLKTFFT